MPDRKPFPAPQRPDETPKEGAQELVRLNKVLADYGIASRRRCDELIATGHVSVDGRVVTELGTRVGSEQQIEVDGEPLRRTSTRARYYLLNKPSGVFCTNDVREARTRAIDLITDRDKGRIYTVGRLDEETTGLVILTSDGDFANRVMHPRYGVTKSYRVRLAGRIDDEALQKVRDGVRLSEGRTSGARILVERRTDRSSDLIVVLNEGKNREVRRIFAQVGFKVSRLHRERIGTLDDRGLKLGAWRPLARAEVDSLLDPSLPQNQGLPGRGRARTRRPQSARAGVRKTSRPGWAPGAGPRPGGGGRTQRGGRA